MIVGERKEKFSFGSISEIVDEKDKHNLDNIDDVDIWTEPWPTEPVYKIREIELEVRRLGRGLTDEEMEKFRAN